MIRGLVLTLKCRRAGAALTWVAVATLIAAVTQLSPFIVLDSAISRPLRPIPTWEILVMITACVLPAIMHHGVGPLAMHPPWSRGMIHITVTTLAVLGTQIPLSVFWWRLHLLTTKADVPMWGRMMASGALYCAIGLLTVRGAGPHLGPLISGVMCALLPVLQSYLPWVLWDRHLTAGIRPIDGWWHNILFLSVAVIATGLPRGILRRVFP
ncbi:hypothetical protein KEM60_03320 [Austwickia sp. TVS 96-490-7B]|uniref:hypothetical protein n=1 Tax=Austwickia sp. TVS 96-490-7B TaxID=2830843 RepID=UPI001C59C9F7|nr:hypothetical protein [Austwickia sp. TVS 96-490-7B]MBW3087090.1 hypothetical protein [Austwickia sp. TVS 96-490-7B]